MSNNVFPVPMIVRDRDSAERGAANTVFADRIVGTRIPSIAAQFQYNLPETNAAPEIVSTGTIVTNDSMLKLATGIATDGSAKIQSADYLRYIPGHEAYAIFTCVFATPVEGLTQRTGLFDDDSGTGNGFFIQFEGVVFSIVRRRNGVDTITIINISDVLPTTSGVFDPTKGNVFKISYGYLGFAPVNFEIMLPTNDFYLFAKIEFPNSDVETHIGNSNLPVRVEITNSGKTTNSEIRIGSFSSGIVGSAGADPTSRLFSESLPETTIQGGATPVQLVHFRNKTTYAGIKNKITTQLLLVSASTEGNKAVSWAIIRNATTTTPGTWADTDADSIIEVSTDEVVDVTTGKSLLFWRMAKADSFFEEVENLLIKLRPGEQVTVIVQSQATNDVGLSIRYKDLF